MENVSRKRRKEEGRRLKKQRIEQGGGVRPRESGVQEKYGKGLERKHTQNESHNRRPRDWNKGGRKNSQFGRVMDHVPCRNRPRMATLSIAVPGSVVSNCQTRELKTQLVGQIARAATIYHVDEIVVFDDKLSARKHGMSRGGRREVSKGGFENSMTKSNGNGTSQLPEADRSTNEHRPRSSDPHTFMARILQYCECPQYLRRNFFPMHPDLQFAGLLAPIDAPHHVRADDRCKYREGVVLDKTGPHAGSLVNCGIRGKPVEIEERLTPGIRCTIQLDPKDYGKSEQLKGRVVSPSMPREDDGTYWGYTCRLASSIKEAIDDCPFEGGYDLKIGTSERGSLDVESKKYSLPSFKHCLIVFGGVAGIEECVDADESIRLPGSESRKLFDQWVNICPFQGSRTIRTEEAILIALAKYSPLLTSAECKETLPEEETEPRKDVPAIDFTDNELSDESSSSEDG